MNSYICPRCNGNGRIEKYNHVENGICFECSGSGRVTEEEKDRIEKDIVREIKKQKSRQDAKQKKLIESLKEQWFHDADIIYIIDNCNTYTIKEQLKQDGALFNNTFKIWYFINNNNNNYNLFSIAWEEVITSDIFALNMEKLIQARSKNGLKGY